MRLSNCHTTLSFATLTALAAAIALWPEATRPPDPMTASPAGIIEGGRDEIQINHLPSPPAPPVIADAADTAPALAELVVQPLGFAETANALFEAIAKDAPRGNYPRGFSGEQPYWTVVGLDGGEGEVLVSEDGAVELGVGAPALEPFLRVDGRFASWSDVTPVQTLLDGDLPIPSVAWAAHGIRLTTTALATRDRLYRQHDLDPPVAGFDRSAEGPAVDDSTPPPIESEVENIRRRLNAIAARERSTPGLER